MFYSPPITDSRVTQQTAPHAGRIFDAGPRGYDDPRQVTYPVGGGSVPAAYAIIEELASDISVVNQGGQGGQSTFVPPDLPDFNVPALSVDINIGGMEANWGVNVVNPPPLMIESQPSADSEDGVAGADPGESPLQVFIKSLDQVPQVNDGGARWQRVRGDGVWLKVENGTFISHIGPGPVVYTDGHPSPPWIYGAGGLQLDAHGHVLKVAALTSVVFCTTNYTYYGPEA